MTDNERKLTVDRLRQIVAINVAGDGLVWKPRAGESHGKLGDVARWNARHAGKPALASLSSDGYLRGRIHWRYYAAHRVIWAISHGRWPKNLIDHINGNPKDNRLDNLREVTRVENARNSKRSRLNTTGRTGVTRSNRNGKYIAHIGVNGTKRHIGWFDSLEEAVAAREAEERRIGFHPNHGRPADSAASHHFFDRF